MESTDPSDAWTKGTSINLSDDAVIMVKLQDKDALPISKEELSHYHIVYYDGNPTTCLRNFLRLNNYEIFRTYRDSAAHAHSNRILQEDGSIARDLAINFVKDNTHLSKEPPIFSPEDIAQIAEVAVNSNIVNLTNRVFPESVVTFFKNNDRIPEDKRQTYCAIAKFVVASGMKKIEDGMFTFKTDEEILDSIEKIDQSFETNLPFDPRSQAKRIKKGFTLYRYRFN